MNEKCSTEAPTVSSHQNYEPSGVLCSSTSRFSETLNPSQSGSLYHFPSHTLTHEYKHVWIHDFTSCLSVTETELLSLNGKCQTLNYKYLPSLTYSKSGAGSLSDVTLWCTVLFYHRFMRFWFQTFWLHVNFAQFRTFDQSKSSSSFCVSIYYAPLKSGSGKRSPNK